MSAITTNSDSSQDEQHPVIHHVNYLRQRFNWDCGVTCVLMLLKADEQQQALQDFDKICQEEGFGRSTWTIDLCYLLKRFNINHHMYTTNIGVNASHNKQKYYRNIIDIDRSRVERRFSAARAAGVSVSSARLAAGALAAHVRGHGPAILLVDNKRLGRPLASLCIDFRLCFGSSYSGHYILVVGVTGSRFLFMDPGADGRIFSISPRRLMAAWAADGTDNDVILIYYKAEKT